MAKFCMHCGSAMVDEAKFCANCGQANEPAAPAQPVAPPQPEYQAPAAPAQPVYQQPVYQAPVYQQPVYQQPNSPQQTGRTMGIFALILGIICFLASLGGSTAALVERYAEEDVNTLTSATDSMMQGMGDSLGLPSHITDQATNAMSSVTNTINQVYDSMADRVFETYLPLFIGVMVLSVLSIVFGILAMTKGYRNGISISGLILAILAIIIVVVTIIVIKSDSSDAEDVAAGANNVGTSASQNIGSIGHATAQQENSRASFTCEACGEKSYGAAKFVEMSGKDCLICEDCYDTYMLYMSGANALAEEGY